MLTSTCSSTRTRRSFENGYRRCSRVEKDMFEPLEGPREQNPPKGGMYASVSSPEKVRVKTPGLRLANVHRDQPSLQPSPVSRRPGTGDSLRRLFDVVNSLLFHQLVSIIGRILRECTSC